jgi:trk system potassium uptake protein
LASKRFRPFERMRGDTGQLASPPKARVTGEIAVIGLGRFGSALARTLMSMGHEVLGIDSDLAVVQEHASDLTHVSQADSTNIGALRQLGVGDFGTAVVGIGGDVEASVLTAAALVDLEVADIWAKAITESHGRILERVGAHHVVFPEHEMGERVAHLVTGRMIDYIELDESFALVETRPPPEMVGKTLGEAGVRARYGVTVVCIQPEGRPFTYATADTVVQAGDILLVAGENRQAERFADLT